MFSSSRYLKKEETGGDWLRKILKFKGAIFADKGKKISKTSESL